MRTVPALIVCAVAATAAVRADDWAQWRGPGGAGVVQSGRPPATWPAALSKRWSLDVGIGHASPIVSGPTAYVFAREGEREVLRAIEVGSGKELWRSGYDAPYEMNSGARAHGQGPKATPLLHQGRVFTLGISGIVSANDAATGKVLWRKTFAGDRSGPPEFGAATSPVADERRVIVFVGTTGKGALTAYDAATGTEQWSWAGDGPGYATPVIATIGGTRQVITQSQRSIVSVAASDGRLLWQVPYVTPYEQNIVTPLVVGDRVVFSGIDTSTFAMRPRLQGTAWTVEKVWDAATVPMYMSSPVALGDTLFGFTHRQRGQLFSLDAATGKMLWTGPPRLGENAAIVALGQSLLVLVDTGELMVVAGSGKGYQVERRYTVADSPTWAHPVPVASRSAGVDGVLIKDERRVALWTWGG
jgi:outer membrane protein assembly factor BamB